MPPSSHDSASKRTRRFGTGSVRAPLASLIVAASVAPAAHATDGCLALLCLAAPSWRDIPMCVPTIRQLLRDLARGKPFPVCGMGGKDNDAYHTWSEAPHFCPPQYTRVFDDGIRNVYTCDYVGAVSVQVNGSLFARTWWNFDGQTVTDFTPQAKRQLGSWDKRFDDEYAAWLSLQPPAPAPDSNP